MATISYIKIAVFLILHFSFTNNVSYNTTEILQNKKIYVTENKPFSGKKENKQNIRKEAPKQKITITVGNWSKK